MGAFAPIEKYVYLNEKGELSIADGKTLEDILSKLYYYETVENEHSITATWKILDEYVISCRNFEEYRRVCYAYNLPISDLLKNYSDITSRTRNALNKAGIVKVADLINSENKWGWSVIDKIPGVGKQQYLIIFRAVHKLKQWGYFGKADDGTEFGYEE